MKNLIILFSIYFVSFDLFSSDNTYFPNVVYDLDNRIEVLDHPDFKVQNTAFSTAALFEKDLLKKKNNTYQFIYSNPFLSTVQKFCPEERFLNQPTAAKCSGTLIDEDIILTAAHCIENNCQNDIWVFDYYIKKNQNTASLEFNSSQVYKCLQILDYKFEKHTGRDYAVVKLDRKVLDRPPVKYRTKDNIDFNEDVFVAGYPLGLPLKIATDAQVLNSYSPYEFQINADVYFGNSGSGVFNLKTLELEGVLYGGDQDFEFDKTRNCLKTKVIKTDDMLSFERATRVTVIDYLKLKN